MPKKATEHQKTPVMVRMPPELHKILAKQAKQHDRSVGAEALNLIRTGIESKTR